MIEKKILDFLIQLKENNNREWFTENKKLYTDAKSSFDNFLNDLIPQIRKFDNTLGLLEAKDCTFRIYRDVRFSKDKSPYKANMGGYMAKGGRKAMNPGYYIHIEPGQSFLAGGLYMPPADQLKKVRDEIYYNIDEFKSIINDKKFVKYFDGFEISEKLKNPPKGFDKEWPDIDLLKYKSYAVAHYVDDKTLTGKGFTDYALGVYMELHKLNQFLLRAIA